MKRILPTCAAALLLTACFGPGSPASILRNPDASELARVSAVDQLSDTKLLWRMALSNAPFPVRKAAAARVLALDEAGFWEWVERDYKGVEGALWKWICKEAGERKEKRALRALVLSWGKWDPAQDIWSRPEKSAIEAILDLAPESIDATRPTIHTFLYSFIEGKEMPQDEAMQKAALFIVVRRAEKTSPCFFVSAVTGDIPDNSPLAVLNKVHLDTLPMVEEELEITKLQATLPQLPNQTPVAPRGLALARRNLLADTFTPLAPPIPRTTDAPLLSKTPPSSTDTAVCAEILRGLRANPSLVAALFKEADRDLSDTRTEHGGLLLWNDNNEVVFEAVAPEMRSHDGTYLPPESLFVKLRDGLAHVHFHAQKHDNGEYAGPGRGDLIFSENNRVNAVVFTFVDENTLNVDAFFPGKIVVDLGCIRRQK